jgi:hypothetical protein
MHPAVSHRTGYIAPSWRSGQSASMKRLRPSNDNKRNPPPMARYVWDVYRAAARSRWVGQVVAATADDAVKAAAVEFKTDAWKLIAHTS